MFWAPKGIRFFAAEIKPYRWRAIYATTLDAVGALAEVGLLLLIGGMASQLSSHRALLLPLGPLGRSGGVGTLLGLGLLFVTLRTTALTAAMWLKAAIAAEHGFRTRSALIRDYVSAPHHQRRSTASSDFLSVVVWSADASQSLVEAGLRSLQPLVAFLVLLCGSIAAGPVVSVAGTVLTGLILLALWPLSRAANRLASARAIRLAQLTGDVNEICALEREITVFGAGAYFLETAGKALSSVRRFTRMTVWLAGTGTIAFHGALFAAALLSLAAVMRLDPSTASRTVPVVLLLVRALSYGQHFQAGLHSLEELAPHLDRVSDVMRRLAAAQPEVCGNAVSGVRLRGPIDTVRLEQATFRYGDGTFGVKNVSVEVKRGEMVGIAGPSGGGKSTLVSVLLGLLEPTEGRVLVNGIDLRSLDRGSWNRYTAIVPQDPVLIRASVAENIRFGRNELSDNSVRRAAEQSGVAGEIAEINNGYEEAAGERGSRFSGGQRQRICVARAVAGNPALLVLDEPTSSLDPRSEQVIHRVLETLRRNAIIVVITHRKSTAVKCDRLLVMKAGRLEFDGPPDIAWSVAHGEGAVSSTQLARITGA